MYVSLYIIMCTIRSSMQDEATDSPQKEQYSGTSLLWTLLGQKKTKKLALIREVSLFQRLICTQKYTQKLS